MKVIRALYFVCGALLIQARCSAHENVHISFDGFLPETPYKNALIACMELYSFLHHNEQSFADKCYWHDIVLGKVVYAEHALKALSTYIAQGGYCSPDHLAYLIKIGLSLDQTNLNEQDDHAKQRLVRSSFQQFLRNFVRN